MCRDRHRCLSLLLMYAFVVKGKRKALCLELTVKEQELVLADMKLHIVHASAEQLVSQHEMKKWCGSYLWRSKLCKIK
jgi:hypothetical protein